MTKNNIITSSKNKVVNFIKKNNKRTVSTDNSIFMCPVSKLKFDPDYQKIYNQEPEKVKRIAADMINGYDNSQPIIINSNYEILDGYSRYEAIKLLNGKITEIPVSMKKFDSRDQYIKYILHLQMDRRSSSDRDKYQTFLMYCELKENAKKQGHDTSEYSEERLAEKLSVSKRQISMLNEIKKKITTELLNKLENGEYSINQVYSAIKKSEKKDSPVEKPKPNVNMESVHIGIKFAFIMLAQGKKPSEIWNDPRIADDIKSIDFTETEIERFSKIINGTN